MTAGLDVALVRQVLRKSGLSNRATWVLLLPLGRKARMETMLRNRRSVLEAKSAVLDWLFRAQKALEPLALKTDEQAQWALSDPRQQKLLIACGLGRASLAEEMSRSGAECGAALDQALRELLAEQRVLRVTAPAGEELYLVVHTRGRDGYDTTAISRILEQGTRYADRLRARERSRSTTNEGRTYRL